MTGLLPPGALAGAMGALWGLGGYALLWGETPIVVTRRFVLSGAGTALLLPARVVLWGIRQVEVRVAGRSFDLSSAHGWIAPVAALVGAGIVVAAFVLVRAALRRLRRPLSAGKP